jgi:hypothetical protein
MAPSPYVYPPQRDVVFVLGAGASAPDGVPLQKDLIELILRDEGLGISKTYTGDMVEQYITTFFDDEVQTGNYPSLEEVFGFTDYHLAHGEHLSDCGRHGVWRMRGTGL